MGEESEEQLLSRILKKVKHLGDGKNVVGKKAAAPAKLPLNLINLSFQFLYNCIHTNVWVNLKVYIYRYYLCICVCLCKVVPTGIPRHGVMELSTEFFLKICPKGIWVLNFFP